MHGSGCVHMHVCVICLSLSLSLCMSLSVCVYMCVCLCLGWGGGGGGGTRYQPIDSRCMFGKEVIHLPTTHPNLISNTSLKVDNVHKDPLQTCNWNIIPLFCFHFLLRISDCLLLHVHLHVFCVQKYNFYILMSSTQS